MRYWLTLILLLTLTPTVWASPYRIEIHKSDHKLVLYKNGNPVKKYKIALGKHPNGAKTQQGDKKTPEGHYYVCGKQIGRFGPFLRVSYPAPKDAEQGLKKGIINKNTYHKVVQLASRGGVPPQNTRLGGNVGIHGWSRTFSSDNWKDWTAGCIALTNQDARELYQIVPTGTRLDIFP